MIVFDIGLDLFPMLAGVLAAVGCGLLGNFLVLRRLSLMGDAISHSVLPGLVIAFLITSTRGPLVMFVGAAVAGLGTVVLVEVVKRFGRVEPGAAMGVVFSVLFALGVLLIEGASVRHVDLDADCVLHGQLETLVWYGAPETIGGLFSLSNLESVPRQVAVLVIMAVGVVLFIGMFFKELRISAFDPGLATTQGYSAMAMHYALMVFVAFATVASFEAVGSILVIAMLICPASTARLLTDRLLPQIVWSGVISVICGIGGYAAAVLVPAAFGKDAVNAAGMMTVVAGSLLVLAMCLSPSHGLIPRFIRWRRLARRIATDDLLALLYRAKEAGAGSVAYRSAERLLVGRRTEPAVSTLARRGMLRRDGGSISLTERGEDAARKLVRKHRLWERYLVDRAGLAPDHVHGIAEELEHISVRPPGGPATDPHGRDIPAGD